MLVIPKKLIGDGKMVEKITGIEGIKPVEVRRAGVSKGENFSDILQSLLVERKENVKPPSPSTPIIRIERIDEIEKEARDLVEEILGDLDRYREKLGDRSISLKEVGKVLEAVEEKAVKLAGIRKKLPDKMPLSRILDEVLSLIYTEGVKFRRGDYL